MERCGFGFRPLELLWLPAGVVLRAAARFLPEVDAPAEPGMWVATALKPGSSLAVLASCGLPLALA